MADDDALSNALLRGAGAVGVGAGVLALFPALATTVSLTTVLTFARTTGSRCGSAPAGLATIHQLGDGNCFAAEEVTARTTGNVGLYEATVWLPTTGDVPDEENADWAWFGGLVGAYHGTRNGRRQAALVVEDAPRPAPGCRTRPRQAVTVLLRVDQSCHADRPITWWHDTGAGQARYTRCDPDGSYSDTVFTWLPLPGVRVAVRATSAPACSPPLNRPGRRHSRECGRRSPRSNECECRI